MEQQTESDWNALSPADKAGSLAESAAAAQREGQDQMAYAYYGQALNLYRGLDDRVNIVRLLIRLCYLAGWADFHAGGVSRRLLLSRPALVCGS